MTRLDTLGLLHHVMIRGIERRLGMTRVDLAMELDLTIAAVTFAVQRGEKMAKERGYQLET